ncbi:MAG: 2Fe-2S iron-sulfur cluster binding domain-containing protein [Nocardiopsaceae bacterium]|nr:2Fe-2S iron-sulfur cluster binding domain-containing protein [Nocardiopsaceae bacterium]
MADKHVVRFEPVGIEIEADEDQTILRAAAEQGIMLMHGCKEGQCASCKSFVLDGDDIELDRYSTFALPEFEQEEGYTLLCRAHAYEDVTIELLNYDEEMIRSGLPIQRAVAEVAAIVPVTHDMRHLVLRVTGPAPGELKFFPGQYMDIAVPGTGEARSFSMANTSARDGFLEFVIKVYPGGLFSEFLDRELKVGDRLELTGPFGVFTLREGDADLVFVGGGAGIAPILSLLRSMAERGIGRKATFFYGARTAADLCFEEELRSLEEKLPHFTYIPALSEPPPSGPQPSPSGPQPPPSAHKSDIYGMSEWTGETGLITDVVKRRAADLLGDLTKAHAYVCGPPPMVEAAIPLLETLGVPEKRIYYDKFTTTGESQ